MINNAALKRISYYLVALASFFFLSWAAADIISAGVNLILSGTAGGNPAKQRALPLPPEGGAPPDPGYDSIYRQMVMDRLGDSGARFLVSGFIFLLAKRKIRELKEG